MYRCTRYVGGRPYFWLSLECRLSPRLRPSRGGPCKGALRPFETIADRSVPDRPRFAALRGWPSERAGSARKRSSAECVDCAIPETPCERASSILCRPLSLRYATRYARRLSNPSTNCNLHFQIDERRRYWDQISQQDSSESCGQFEPGMTARHEFPIASNRRYR